MKFNLRVFIPLVFFVQGTTACVQKRSQEGNVESHHSAAVDQPEYANFDEFSMHTIEVPLKNKSDLVESQQVKVLVRKVGTKSRPMYELHFPVNNKKQANEILEVFRKRLLETKGNNLHGIMNELDAEPAPIVPIFEQDAFHHGGIIDTAYEKLADGKYLTAETADAMTIRFHPEKGFDLGKDFFQILKELKLAHLAR